jgi:adenosylhomocysteine nucleosidase
MRVDHFGFAVLVSANAEWKAVKSAFPNVHIDNSPYGEYFFEQVDEEKVLFCHGGWGKVAAAASTQYVIDHFNPEYLINIGTCGGIEGRIRRFDVVAPDRVVIYDIHEAMGDDPRQGVTTELEMPAQFPTACVRTTLYSADRDLTPARLREIEDQYRPVVVDWESGAIAWVAKRNGTPLLILRGVSDLVSLEEAEAQGNEALFEANAARIMQGLIRDLSKWMRSLR